MSTFDRLYELVEATNKKEEEEEIDWPIFDF